MLDLAVIARFLGDTGRTFWNATRYWYSGILPPDHQGSTPTSALSNLFERLLRDTLDPPM